MLPGTPLLHVAGPRRHAIPVYLARQFLGAIGKDTRHRWHQFWLPGTSNRGLLLLRWLQSNRRVQHDENHWLRPAPTTTRCPDLQHSSDPSEEGAFESEEFAIEDQEAFLDDDEYFGDFAEMRSVASGGGSILLGGFPEFTQEYETPEGFVHFLEIQSTFFGDAKLPFETMWGDAGIAHLFLRPSALELMRAGEPVTLRADADGTTEDSIWYWDCH